MKDWIRVLDLFAGTQSVPPKLIKDIITQLLGDK